MKAPYQYTWKNGISGCSNRAVGFHVPLQKDMIFFDLLTGQGYKVFSIYKAKENDRDNLEMPEDVVQTFSAKSLSEVELANLREKHNFKPDARPEPGLEFSFVD